MTVRPDSTDRVRVPADVDRPDRILAGLTVRQLALLAVAAVGLWAAYAATRPFVPLVAFAVVAVPFAVAAVALALGRVDGQPADRFAAAAVSFHRSPRRLVPAPDGLGPVPAGLAGRAGTPPTPLRLPLADVDPQGVVDLGPEGTAIACRARAVPFKLRTPAEQEAMVAGFARFLNSLSEPIQIVVRAEPVDLSPAVDALEAAAPALAHPALEAAARAHASFLADLGGRGLLSRQVLVVLRQPAPTS
ncbi:MAG: PrgI family protein, partial [Acidimicrobiales bacterium]|nr:PrgI family protein [Acidimicrobiales bacterium]